MPKLGKKSCLILTSLSFAAAIQAQTTYRLYEGITAYVHNPEGKAFAVQVDLRDINAFVSGPREALFKVYDPDGKPVAREIIPDDGIAAKSFMPRVGGWDHELQYYALCYERLETPMMRFSAYSDPARLEALAKRTFTREIPGGKKGIYRILLAGDHDHYATLKITPALQYGVCGHPFFLHGHHDLWKQSYIYVPKGSVGLHLAFAEPDAPRSRHFTLTAPDGKKLFDGAAPGSFTTAEIKFDVPGVYDGQLLTLQVSDGPGDYLVRVIFQRKDGFADYSGMGSHAILTPDKATALAIQGGAIIEDGEVFWHPFQARFHRWLKDHKPGEDEKQKKQFEELASLSSKFRHLGPSDAREAAGWSNLAYAFGYYGCKLWRPSWILMRDENVPADVKEIIREGLIIGGDRLGFIHSLERVNGNAFAQIPVALWYCQAATGDAIQKERFNLFIDRWRSEGWGPGCGISKSGDAQEHFAHDMHYGSYIMDNWATGGQGTWVQPGILDDTDDPRFREAYERIRNLYTYTHCRDERGVPVPANPWSSRTHAWAHGGEKWMKGELKWKGEPGPDFTVSVNDGDEWFAARRKNYYMVTFHGRLAPAWLTHTFHGQIGFGGGIICQLTVPGKGVVLASILPESYGKGMDLPNWRNFHIHSIVGEMADGRPLVSGVSEHENAKLNGNVVSSSGEVRDLPVRVARKFTFGQDAVECEVNLATTDYREILTLWSKERPLSEIKTAYEMIPFQPGAKAAILASAGAQPVDLSSTPASAQTIVIDRGGYGVKVELDQPRNVLLGANDTALIELVNKPTTSDNIALKYRLTPY